ncbi:MAG: carboxypeptidase M32 [Phycisphaerales bacterium]|nr:carboxypeptidase M32 [Phycisphaerales bacterium]
MPQSPYSQILALAREAHLIGGTEAILSWDQETMMPSGGVEYRSRQVAQLARLHHEMATAPRVGELLNQCEQPSGLNGADPDSAPANLRELRRDYDRATKLPGSLVEELAKVSSVSQHEWAQARKESDFARFQPHLSRLVELNRQKAECLGIPSSGEAWDALADLYEPGCTAADVVKVFIPLRKRLQALLDRVLGSSKGPSKRFNETALPIEAQERFVRFIAESIGFDFSRGRLDRSTHPFCGGSHCNDIRMTTRYSETCVNDGLGSTMHESGHGMYEQGIRFEHIGTPMGEAVSLAIHESQSRLWENQVGRSRQFWQWTAQQLPKYFDDRVAGFPVEELYGAANVVEPGFIRVDADEATYNMHVMIRFELERKLIDGSLDVADLPGAWNSLYREYLQVDVPDDRRGCLQDVHWSMGAFGYFPTYTLGTLYSAQFFESACAANPGLVEGFSKGKFQPLREWLNDNIHVQGRKFRPAELCVRVTGKPLSAEPLMRHLEGKLLPLYGLI